jgi:hypothetical protein
MFVAFTEIALLEKALPNHQIHNTVIKKAYY